MSITLENHNNNIIRITFPVHGLGSGLCLKRRGLSQVGLRLFFYWRKQMVYIEQPFTKDQTDFIQRYKDGKKFTMGELDSIPSKFWDEYGHGINIKAVTEKIEDDKIIQK